jgi:hypothetical protein
MVTTTGPSHGFSPFTSTSPDARSMRLVAQSRLSGAVYAGPTCNPADLTVPSFSRVSDTDIDERLPVIKSRGVFVTEDDLDW